MKIIKKIFTIFLSILLIFLFLFLALTINLESLAIDNINDNMVKPQVTEQIINVIKEKYPNFDDEKIQKLKNELLSNPDIDEITKVYIQNIIDNALSKTNNNIPNTKEDIIAIVNRLNLSDSQKQIIIEEINETEIETVYNKIEIEVEKKLDQNNIKFIKIYNFLISNMFNYCLVALIILLCIIILLLADYFMLNLGISIMMSSFTIVLLLPKILSEISKKYEIIRNINIANIIKYGYLYFIIGAVFIITHLIFMIIKRSKKCLQD